jgi:N-acetylglucosamine-6-phosphate deacetylase
VEYPSSFVIENINLLEDGQLIEDGIMLIDEGLIRFAGRRGDFVLAEYTLTLDGKGWFAAPGFIDLQLNGAYWVDFSSNPDGINKVAARIPETGVTAFLVTFITSPMDDYPEKLRATLAAQAEVAEITKTHKPAARVLGAHLEGPFLNPEMPGAHQPELFRYMTVDNLQKLTPLEAVRLMTLAVEMPGGLEAVRWLHARGVTVSIGHSNATAEQGLQAFTEGVGYVTHLFNAMLPLHHRNPGLVGAVLGSTQARCGLIVDGIHVNPLVVRMVYQCLGTGRMTLVTDAMAAMGMPPGVYKIGGQEVWVNETSARLQDRRLAGSVLRMDQAVRNMVEFSGCSMAEAVRMASTTPAEVLGIDDRLGHLKEGYQADIVLLDKSMQVQATYIGGSLA